MSNRTDELKVTLRKLRDKLAFEAPRVQTRPGVPAELAIRMQTTLRRLGAALSSTGAPQELEELYEDVLVEAHLTLHEWERATAQAAPERGRPSVGAPVDRRQHARQDTQVTVKLLRHGVRQDGRSGTLEPETVSRAARNASLGGILVAAGRDDLPDVGVGSVVHLSVSLGELTFRARASVVRRDQDSLGLRWIQDTDGVKRAVKALLDALKSGR